MQIRITFFKALTMAVAFCIIACGPSPREEREAEEAKRDAERIVRQNQWQEILSELSDRFNAVTLDEQLNSGSYTYELQRFFDEHSGDNILFEGYLGDLEQTPKGLFVEVAYKLRKSMFNAPSLIVFRMSADGEMVDKILRAERVTGWKRESLYLRSPNCAIVADVNGIEKVKRYEYSGSGDDDDGNLVSIHTPHRYIARGRLVHITMRDETQ
jgi:YD repeat-containing protein